jgi:hypothetical protein
LKNDILGVLASWSWIFIIKFKNSNKFMNFNKEELATDFSEFLKATLENSPEMNMEEFIYKYFDEIVCKSQLSMNF